MNYPNHIRRILYIGLGGAGIKSILSARAEYANFYGRERLIVDKYPGAGRFAIFYGIDYDAPIPYYYDDENNIRYDVRLDSFLQLGRHHSGSVTSTVSSLYSQKRRCKVCFCRN